MLYKCYINAFCQLLVAWVLCSAGEIMGLESERAQHLDVKNDKERPPLQ